MEIENTHNPEIHFTNEQEIKAVIERMKKDGADKLHVLADFDNTLTLAHVDDKPVPSMVSILRDGDYLTPDYAAKAHALYNHYAPMEHDLSIPKEDRKKAMAQWWGTHFKLLIESGLTKEVVKRAIDSGKIKFRDGVLQFLEALKGNNVPIIIMSSSALGGDAIESCLKKEGHYFDNITIISNTFIWDEKGRAVGTHEPHLHAMSKEETIINNFPIYEEIKHRPNVILLGDTLGDVGMAVGFPYDNLIKIGFLNKDAQKRLDDFQKYYDITITNDGTFEYVNEVLQKILNN